MSAPKTLKDFVHQFKHRKQILDIEEEHIGDERNKLNTKFGSFCNSFMVDVLLFVTALIMIIIKLIVIYVVCSPSKLKAMVTNIALQHLKGVEAIDSRFQDVYCTCKIQWYIIALFLLILLGIVS